MTGASSTRGTARLRLLLAEIIAENVKAYDLPMLGERLGLAAGTEEEAFSSKRMYVSRRLSALNEAEVRCVGRELSRDFANDELEQLLGDSSPADEGISNGRPPPME